MSELWSLNRIIDQFAYLVGITNKKASDWLAMTITQEELDYIVNRSTDDPKANLLILILSLMALKFGDYHNPRILWLEQQITFRREKLSSTVYSINEAKLLGLPYYKEDNKHQNSLKYDDLVSYGTTYQVSDPYAGYAQSSESPYANLQGINPLGQEVTITFPTYGKYPFDTTTTETPQFLPYASPITNPYPHTMLLSNEEAQLILDRRAGHKPIEKEVIIEVQPIKKGRKFKGVF
jgi:hypothetical protein